jgi:hypothetical protein
MKKRLSFFNKHDKEERLFDNTEGNRYEGIMFKRGSDPKSAWRERYFVLLRDKKELWYFKSDKV